jgi:hypothetical protein
LMLSNSSSVGPRPFGGDGLLVWLLVCRNKEADGKVGSNFGCPCQPSLLAGSGSVDGGNDLTFQGGIDQLIYCAFEAYLLTGGRRLSWK